MKKGVKLLEVLIERGRVTGYGVDKNGDTIDFPLSRSQRNLFLKFSGDTPEFRKQVIREFGADILAEGFFVTNKDA